MNSLNERCKKLIARNISKSYGSRTILKDFNIEASQNEIIALLGPNGAGKTTSFYIMIGTISATHGKIIFDNTDITNVPLYMRSRLGIGYLPQEASIFRKLSVEDNLRIALEVKYGNDQEKINKKIEQLLDEFNIQHIRHSIGGVLSGGERRRVEVARVLAIEPFFLLLDEPFAGVDPIAVNDIKNLIFSLKKRGIGVIITDHNVRETLEIVDKAYILFDGNIICSGTPTEIIANEKVRQIYLGNDFEIKKHTVHNNIA